MIMKRRRKRTEEMAVEERERGRRPRSDVVVKVRYDIKNF